METIVNAYIGDGWYDKGSTRLRDTLFEQEWYNLITFRNVAINKYYNDDCRYTIKTAAMKEVISDGFKTILWADCSMMAIKNPKAIFDKIKKDGIYVETNGYNAAQECSDVCLNYFDISRDEAENIPMCSSGMLGFDITTDIGKSFINKFVQASIDGIFNGSREHNNQSSDSRFLHHRQDQSAASIILYKLGYKIPELNTFLSYKGAEHKKTIFVCQGM